MAKFIIGILVGIVLLLVVLIIWFLPWPSVVTEEHIADENEWCKPIEVTSTTSNSANFTQNKNPGYWDNQITGTGLSTDIQAVLDAVAAELGITFTIIEEMPLDPGVIVGDSLPMLVAGDSGAATPSPTPEIVASPQPPGPVTPAATPTASSDGAPPAEPRVLIAGLYEFFDPTSSVTVQQVVMEARDAVSDLAADGSVLAVVEPNYVVIAGPHGISGAPHGISGGPHGISGGPHGISGGLLGILGGGTRARANAATDQFKNQWPLQSAHGMELVDTNGDLVQGIDASGVMGGEPVKVLVFDSSRMAEQGAWELTRGRNMSVDLCVHLPETPYMQHVFGGQDLANANGLYESRINGPEKLPVNPAIEHGLFSAGLVNLVAPEAQVHLVRVIDDEGFGDMYSLIKTLWAFMQPEYAYSVINLSFGMHIHVEEESEAGEETAEENGEHDVTGIDQSTLAAIKEMAMLSSLPVPTDASDVPYTLRIPFQVAAMNHSFVAAAAGNGSSHVLHQIEMDFPGMYGEMPFDGETLPILAVGASNIDRDWTCYTNDAHVLAPSGDGKIPLSKSTSFTGPSYNCIPAAEKCLSMEDGPCRFGVTSLVSSAASRTGYAYWSGTSFSSPLVAGLAALVLDDQTQTGAPIPEPEAVRTTIMNGVCPTGANRPMINVPKTLGASSPGC